MKYLQYFEVGEVLEVLVELLQILPLDYWPALKPPQIREQLEVVWPALSSSEINGVDLARFEVVQLAGDLGCMRKNLFPSGNELRVWLHSKLLVQWSPARLTFPTPMICISSVIYQTPLHNCNLV